LGNFTFIPATNFIHFAQSKETIQIRKAYHQFLQISLLQTLESVTSRNFSITIQAFPENISKKTADNQIKDIHAVLATNPSD
jgi:hypothetical protein